MRHRIGLGVQAWRGSVPMPPAALKVKTSPEHFRNMDFMFQGDRKTTKYTNLTKA
jgi:hypothetical protein